MLRGAVSALGCLLGAAIILVAIPAPHTAQPVPVRYRGDLTRLAALAPYPAVAPAALPGSWQPVSSLLTVGGANGASTISWHLGFMTPDGSLASLEETNAPASAFVQRMTNDGTALPPTRLADRTWSVSATPSRGQRSMYFTSPAGFTVVITGNATWAELRELAASLRTLSS
jgi:Protein of unknown function (DUF4245)